jgi:excisionase family DNA binding protein
MATEMAVGLAIAQQMMQQQPGGGLFGQQPAAGGAPAAAAQPAATGLPELLTPAQVAEALGVPESDVLSIIADGALKAKKIGSSFRIKRSALDEFLAD